VLRLHRHHSVLGLGEVPPQLVALVEPVAALALACSIGW
jgi:hypothetical protein